MCRAASRAARQAEVGCGVCGMKITKDDERARRICSLALAFMNASAPIPSSDIARDFYPGLSADSFRRAFSRDRTVLAACGVVVRERPHPGDESSWSVDEASSYPDGAEIGAMEAAVLEIACQPLIEDPSFPLAGELRFALAKLTRAFAEASPLRAARREDARPLAALRDALTEGRAARISYRDARGRESARLVAPYAFFGLRGELYLVAGRLRDDGSVVEGGTRTYRVDRMNRACIVNDLPVSTPPDFSVDDWRRLPFQMGETTAVARLELPDDREGDVRRAAGANGTFFSLGGRTIWEVEVSSVEDAASWAVAEGVIPIGPAELVEEWRRVLEGVTVDAS